MSVKQKKCDILPDKDRICNRDVYSAKKLDQQEACWVSKINEIFISEVAFGRRLSCHKLSQRGLLHVSDATRQGIGHRCVLRASSHLAIVRCANKLSDM